MKCTFYFFNPSFFCFDALHYFIFYFFLLKTTVILISPFIYFFFFFSFFGSIFSLFFSEFIHKVFYRPTLRSDMSFFNTKPQQAQVVPSGSEYWTPSFVLFFAHRHLSTPELADSQLTEATQPNSLFSNAKALQNLTACLNFQISIHGLKDPIFIYFSPYEPIPL